MIDFHSHVLPRIDDGSKSIEMSLDMLAYSFEQGVNTVVATPHCHLTCEADVEKFLINREASYNTLVNAMKKDSRKFPDIRLGCELRVMDDIPQMNELKPLCIENTDYVLVEMPYKNWTYNHYDFLYAMLLKGMHPIMAHIERFREYKKEFVNLFSLDLLYQVNADSFISRPFKKFIPTLFENGAVQVIGSDMHNTTSRISRMKSAKEAIISGYGNNRWEMLMQNAHDILDNKKVTRQAFAHMSFWDTIKL